MTHKNYLKALFMNGLLYSMLILFTVAGPFLIQTEMHYTAIAFGKMALILGLCWFLGTMTNRFLLNISMEKKISHVFVFNVNDCHSDAFRRDIF